MSSSTRLGCLSVLALLSALAVGACSGRTSDVPSTASNNLNGGASGVCAGKTCGADCTPSGSDEPFNCNASGACVAAGQALECKSASKPVCADKACGTDCTPEGSDEPFNCNATGKCVATGQPLGCACPEFLGDCQKGDRPADLDHDGCIDGCEICPPFVGGCGQGQHPVDGDGDGCVDRCAGP